MRQGSFCPAGRQRLGVLVKGARIADAGQGVIGQRGYPKQPARTSAPLPCQRLPFPTPDPDPSPSPAVALTAALYCKRAELAEGQDILELGCGWGSMSLFMAAAYPNSRVTAVSNSRTQREFIMSRAAERGITNLQVWGLVWTGNGPRHAHHVWRSRLVCWEERKDGIGV